MLFSSYSLGSANQVHALSVHSLDSPRLPCLQLLHDFILSPGQRCLSYIMLKLSILGMAFRAALDAICCWRSPPKASAGPHLPPERSSATKTIIVGGGASGLCTAYNLAKRCRANGQNHCVIVIDKLDDVFAAASRYNSGIISYHWCSGDLRDFARYTYACYEDIAQQDENFRKTTDYGDQSNFRLCRGSVESIARGPEWLNVPAGWHLEPDPVDGRAAIM